MIIILCVFIFGIATGYSFGHNDGFYKACKKYREYLPEESE
jgi:hypothetical protein